MKELPVLSYFFLCYVAVFDDALLTALSLLMTLDRERQLFNCFRLVSLRSC